jgi:hypothetical protein
MSFGTNMPPRMFLNFCKGEPVGWCNTCSQWMFLIFLKGWGLDFPSSSQKVPIKFLLFPSISHQNPFVLTKLPNNYHQVPLVPINNSSKSFYSHQVPIKILLFLWLWRIGSCARRFSVRLLRDSGRVLNRAPQFVGRPEGKLQWQADICRWCSRVGSQDFLPARFCGRSWADLLLMPQSAVLLPSCAQPKN